MFTSSSSLAARRSWAFLDRSARAMTTLLAAGLVALSTAALAQTGTPAPAVTVAEATMQAVARGQSFNGRVVARNKVDLRARVSGFVEERAFTEGARVAAGDLLFRIESGPYQAALDEVNGRIQAADAERRLADLEVARQRDLVGRQASAQAQLDRADANAGVAAGNLAQLIGSRESAALDLSYTEIKAPFDGRIGLARYDVGDFVDQSSGTLATLTSIDPIEVELQVAQSSVLDFQSNLANGTFEKAPEARLTLSNGETYPEGGDLVFIDVEVAEGSDTITLRYEFPNPDGRLLDGQLVRANLAAEDSEPMLTVPVTALQRDQTGTFVMTVGEDDTVARKPVTVSRREGTLAIVTQGLEAGERVITGGLNKVRPGMTVDAAPAATDAGNAPS